MLCAWPSVNLSSHVPAGEGQAGDIGRTIDSPKGSWNEGMLDHRVAGGPIDPHSIEEAENIIESYLMQACLAILTSLTIGTPL